MSRWTIEKSGTGIEKSGTGIEKSGTGIEKSGTGVEKSGTGIEKSGTGIRRGLLSCALASLVLGTNVNAASVDPAGSLQVVVQNNTVAVSWIIGESVFSGVAKLSGSYANLMLTEIALAAPPVLELDVTGNGTGSGTQVTGNRTGSSTKVTGKGTGSSTEVTGNGTGTEVTGNGTGTEVTGNGTGTEVTGNGTGGSIQVTGNGTGSEAINIVLPQATGMMMEVNVGCGAASVTIVDETYAPVVEFADVAVIGAADFCASSPDTYRRSDRNTRF
jgi:hypothetical protein